MTVDQIPIGRFSTITRITQKALRYYDSRGLLVPEAKNSITGYRYYTGDQIQRGILIKYLATMGFGIEEIFTYLEAERTEDTDKMEYLIETRLRETQSELKRLERIASLLDKSKHNELMKETMSEPSIKEEPPVRIISKTEKGITKETIGRILGELMGVIHTPENQSNFVKIVGPPVTIYHDREYNEDEGALEVAFPIIGKVTMTSPEFKVKNLPVRKVAYLVHKGSYETMSLAYKKLYEYIKEKGLDMNGPMAEIYLSDPNTTKPEDILTEIQVMIRPKERL